MLYGSCIIMTCRWYICYFSMASIFSFRFRFPPTLKLAQVNINLKCFFLLFHFRVGELCPPKKKKKTKKKQKTNTCVLKSALFHCGKFYPTSSIYSSNFVNYPIKYAAMRAPGTMCMQSWEYLEDSKILLTFFFAAASNCCKLFLVLRQKYACDFT